jgi:hypothetical protein
MNDDAYGGGRHTRSVWFLKHEGNKYDYAQPSDTDSVIGKS